MAHVLPRTLTVVDWVLRLLLGNKGLIFTMLLSEFVYLLRFFCKLQCELITHILVCELLPRPTLQVTRRARILLTRRRVSDNNSPAGQKGKLGKRHGARKKIVSTRGKRKDTNERHVIGEVDPAAMEEFWLDPGSVGDETNTDSVEEPRRWARSQQRNRVMRQQWSEPGSPSRSRARIRRGSRARGREEGEQGAKQECCR